MDETVVTGPAKRYSTALVLIILLVTTLAGAAIALAILRSA